MLGILRGAAHVNAFCRKVHRPQLGVGFLEEAVRTQRYFEHAPQLGRTGSRDHSCGQNDGIGLEFELLAQNRIDRGDADEAASALFDAFELRLVVRFVADELDVLVRRLEVVILAEAIGPDVAEQHVDFDLGLERLHLQGVLHGSATADAGAVVAVLVAATDALDHHHVLGCQQFFFLLRELAFHLQQRHHLVALAVQVLGWLVLGRARGDDGGTVFDGAYPGLGLDGGREIANVAIHMRYQSIHDGVDLRMPIHLFLQVLQEGLDVHPFKGVVQAVGNAAQVRGFLDQVSLIALLGQGVGADHAGHTAADHQCGLVHRQRKLVKWFEDADPCH